MKVCMAQLELISGDIRGNRDKAIAVIREMRDLVDVILLPELTTTAYNCGCLFESPEFIEDAWHSLQEIAREVFGRAEVIIGCPRYANEPELNGSIRIHNSVYRIKDSEIVDYYDKTHLANGSHHEDRKYFIPNEYDHKMVFKVDGETCAVLICEDIWRNDHYKDLIYELKRHNPDLKHIFVTNYSFFAFGKLDVRMDLARNIAKDYGISVHYCNAVGIGDIVKNVMVYDGNSFYCRYDGVVSSKIGASFSADLVVYDTNDPIEPYDPFVKVVDGKTFSGAENLKNLSFMQAMRYAARSGMALSRIERPEIHVSGGIDSAVVACVLASEFGAEKCIFITNPSECNSTTTKGIAVDLVTALGGTLLWQPIEGIVREGVYALEHADNLGKCKNMEMTTLHAVGRTVLGLASTHRYHSTIFPTGNQTENILGWFNFHDVGSVGLMMLIGDLSKSEIYSFARWLNEHWYQSDVICPMLYTMDDANSVVPMAEVPDSTVDPFDYKLMSGICIAIIRGQMTPKMLMLGYLQNTLPDDFFGHYNGMLSIEVAADVFAKTVDEAWRRSQIAVYKCAQAAPTLVLSNRSRGFSARETIFSQYRPKTASSVLAEWKA